MPSCGGFFFFCYQIDEKYMTLCLFQINLPLETFITFSHGAAALDRRGTQQESIYSTAFNEMGLYSRLW